MSSPQFLDMGHEMILTSLQANISLATQFVCCFFLQGYFQHSLTVIPQTCSPNLCCFGEVSEKEIFKIIKISPTKSCLLDPVPGCLGVWVLYLHQLQKLFPKNPRGLLRPPHKGSVNTKQRFGQLSSGIRTMFHA